MRSLCLGQFSRESAFFLLERGVVFPKRLDLLFVKREFAAEFCKLVFLFLEERLVLQIRARVFLGSSFLFFLKLVALLLEARDLF